MTQPQQGPQPVDPGNELLDEVPAQIMVSKLQTSRGQRLAITIRTASTTLTVMPTKLDALTWARLIAEKAESVSEAGLITPNGHKPKG